MRATRKNTIAGLEAMGCEHASCKSKKYLAFRHWQDQRIFLVGKSGALRVCHLGEATGSSVSLTGFPIHRAIAAVGERAKMYARPEQARADFYSFCNSRQEAHDA